MTFGTRERPLQNADIDRRQFGGLPVDSRGMEGPRSDAGAIPARVRSRTHEAYHSGENAPCEASIADDGQSLRLSGDTSDSSEAPAIPASLSMAGLNARSTTLDTTLSTRPEIHLIEDDPLLLAQGCDFFEAAGYKVRAHISAEAFLAIPRPTGEACLVVDMNLPGMSGLDLLELLQKEGSQLPAIMLTGRDDAATAVAAFRAGVVDFIEKPARQAILIAGVAEAIERARDERTREQARTQAKARFDTLTSRENDVLLLILDGTPNKNIATDLGISQRTVENHRASVMRKVGVASLPALVRLFLAAKGPT